LKCLFLKHKLALPDRKSRFFSLMPTQNKNLVKNVLQTAAYFGAFLIFGVAGSLVSTACAVAGVLFRGRLSRRFGQRLIHMLFRFFVGYLRMFDLIELDADELSELCASNKLIVVANHPDLLDAVLLVSQVPQMVCLMKGSLARNIIFSGTARLAGYIHNKSGLGLVKRCEERLKENANLLVFPEGTRSVGGELLPFTMGFALTAILTQAPVQTVIITTECNCFGKGSSLFKKPTFPVHFSLRLGRRFQPEPGANAKVFGATVENYLREELSSVKNESNLSLTQQK
jgi:1-acyl-sn-glycerol-3-phosphate acyltransferase